MKIIAAIPCRDNYKLWLERSAAGRAELVFANKNELTADMVADADIIIGNPSLSILAAAKKLKWLQTVSAGVEEYVSFAGFPKEVLLTNMTGAFGVLIAEYVMAGVLSMYRHLFEYRKQQEEKVWKSTESEFMLMGKQVLILGAGDIGLETAKRMSAFGAHVTGIRRVVREIPEAFETMGTLDDLDVLLGAADIVVGCLPHTEKTVHILNERRLSLMKKGALLVNVGRGSLVETEALVKAIQNGHLMGAVLDVAEVEPLPKEHPLWEMKQVLLTPHVSGKGFGHVKEIEENIVRICCDNLERYFEGKPLRNQVNRADGYADYSGREQNYGGSND